MDPQTDDTLVRAGDELPARADDELLARAGDELHACADDVSPVRAADEPRAHTGDELLARAANELHARADDELLARVANEPHARSDDELPERAADGPLARVTNDLLARAADALLADESLARVAPCDDDNEVYMPQDVTDLPSSAPDVLKLYVHNCDKRVVASNINSKSNNAVTFPISTLKNKKECKGTKITLKRMCVRKNDKVYLNQSHARPTFSSSSIFSEMNENPACITWATLICFSQQGQKLVSTYQLSLRTIPKTPYAFLTKSQRHSSINL